MIFMVEVRGRVVWQSKALRVEDDPVHLQVALEGAKEFKLIARQPDFPADFKECPPMAKTRDRKTCHGIRRKGKSNEKKQTNSADDRPLSYNSE